MASEAAFRKELVELESRADALLTDKRRIVGLDERRNKNREALRALKRQSESDGSGGKAWYTVGSLMMKLPVKDVVALLEKDQAEINEEVDRLRNGMKKKVEALREMEGSGPLKGFNLTPLSKEEADAFQGTFWRR